MTDVLQVKSLTKSYKKDFWSELFYALNDVSFSVPSGEITGFLGANGAGKTTAIKIVFDFIRANEGRVVFPSYKELNRQAAYKKMGYLPERPYFYPHLTGKEFLTYMGSLNDVSGPNLKSQIERWSKRLQIDHAMSRKLQHYSKGMLQRIGFASTLLHGPEFLILDEPMSGLDPVGRSEFKEIMRELNSERKTIFFSSHIVSDVEEICRSIVFLDKGKLAYQGDIYSLISSNQDDHVEIEYRKGNEFLRKTISPDMVSATIKEILSSSHEVVRVTPIRATLEQIVYKLGNKQ